MGGAGFVYGLALVVLGVLAGVAGHGSAIVLLVSSAPLALAQSFFVALIGRPLLWLSAGILAANASSSRAKIAFAVLMFLHYVSIPGLLVGYGDWEYVSRTPVLTFLGLSVYVAGQVGVWVAFTVGRQPAK